MNMIILAAVAAASAATAHPPKTGPVADIKILRVQVLLDRLGFSPGVIDGKQGFTLKLALSGLQKANVGRMPPDGDSTENTDDDSRSNRRPIELINSPRRHLSQISARCAAE